MTTGRVPFPPYLDRPLPDKFGNGMDRGATKRTGATVWHTMLGTLWGTDAYFRRADVGAATNWGIGGSLDGVDDGTIIRWVAFPGTRIPWASGPWRSPGLGDGQAFVAKYGVYGINADAESIEFSGLQQTPVTAKQWRSGVWLTAAILHDAGVGSGEFLWNMQHREFCQPSYKDCPWPRIYQYTDDYQGAVVNLMRAWEGFPDALATVRIGGVSVALPVPAATPTPPAPTPSPPVIFVPFAKPGMAVSGGAVGRQYGNRSARVLVQYPSGVPIQCVGFYHGENVGNSDRWFVVDSWEHERIHESSIVSWDVKPPELAGNEVSYASV